MESPLHMELPVHDSIFGHLLQQFMKLETLLMFVPVPLTTTGLFKSLHLSATTTFVLLAILDLGFQMILFMLMILCGMVKGVVLLMPAVNLTTLRGSAQHYHNLPLMILK